MNKKRKTKETRYIEIGWLMYDKDEKRYRQMRCQSGGGTRRIAVAKDSLGSDILNVAKGLFFPEGISSQGPLEDFTYELLDFKNHPIQDNLTVAELYEVTALTKLRFYFATKRTDESQHRRQRQEKNLEASVDSIDDKCDYIPATVSSSLSTSASVYFSEFIDVSN